MEILRIMSLVRLESWTMSFIWLKKLFWYLSNVICSKSFGGRFFLRFVWSIRQNRPWISLNWILSSIISGKDRKIYKWLLTLWLRMNLIVGDEKKHSNSSSASTMTAPEKKNNIYEIFQVNALAHCWELCQYSIQFS